jgi:hypothetical protein
MKIKNLSNNMYKLLVICISISLFAYVAYRAYYLSITFDEVWTFDLASQSIKDICSAKRNFSSANNHILNSILIKPCLYLFGHHVWVLRLPNVLSYLFYLLGSFILVGQMSNQNSLRLVGFICLNLNLYLLDFFSLSRGYGLANSFEMMSIALVFIYFKNGKLKHISWSFLFATLSVLANFTWINFFIPFWATLNIYWLVQNRNENRLLFSSFFQRNFSPVLFAIFLVIICFNPIHELAKCNEFKFGANGWFDSFHTFAKDFNYSDSFGYAVIMQVFFMLLYLISFLILMKNKIIFQLQNFSLSFFILAISFIICISIVQRNVLGTMYIDGRKATLYFILVIGLTMSILNYLYLNNQKYSFVIVMTICTYTIIHFLLFMNVSSFRNWTFDQKTKDVIQSIYQKNPNTKMSISMNWLFESSFAYYNRTNYSNHFESIKILHEEKYKDTSDYYYIFKTDMNKMPPNYVVEKEFSFGGVLLIKENLPRK